MGVVGLASYASGHVDDEIGAELDRYTPFHEDPVFLVIGGNRLHLQAQVGGTNLGQAVANLADRTYAGAAGSFAVAAAKMDHNRPDFYIGLAMNF